MTEETLDAPVWAISDGGPSTFYDFPYEWTTLNDYIEHKSIHQWKEYSFHLGNITKAGCRWGDKYGTTKEYDARKIVYSGLRLLVMLKGKTAVMEYLLKLQQDPQFS